MEGCSYSHLSMYVICSRVKRHLGYKTSVQSRKIAHPFFRICTYTSVIESTVTLSISACVFEGRDQACRPFCHFKCRTLFSVTKKSSSSEDSPVNTCVHVMYAWKLSILSRKKWEDLTHCQVCHRSVFHLGFSFLLLRHNFYFF
jgi:hypothetical protein